MQRKRFTKTLNLKLKTGKNIIIAGPIVKNILDQKRIELLERTLEEYRKSI